MTTEAAGPLPPRYRDPVRIGGGGMGQVFRALDEQLGRPVAVKLIAAHIADDPAFRARFAREARAAARIDHPNVVVVHDVGEWQGTPYLVMEYCSGGSVASAAAERPVGRDLALRWVAQAGAAIDAGHAAGVVHRDIKPQNLLLTADGRLKVTDFGVARLLDAAPADVTATGVFIGSSGYAAPEVLMGERAGPAADVYALGVVAYELLTGGRPFGDRTSHAEVMAILSEPLPPASARAVGLPASVDPVLERALDRDPARRPVRASALAQELRAALAGAPATEVARGPRTRVQPPPPPPVPSPHTDDGHAPTGRLSTAPPPRRRSGALALAVLVVALVALGAAAATYLVVSSGGGDGGATTAATARTAPVDTAPTTTAPAVTAPPVTITRVVTRTTPAETQTATVTGVTTASGGGGDGGGGGAAASAAEAQALTDEATRLNSAGRPSEAESVQRRALAYYTSTPEREVYEGNADYNLGRALIDLGRCDEAIAPLAASVTFPGTSGQVRTRQAALQEAQACA